MGRADSLIFWSRRRDLNPALRARAPAAHGHRLRRPPAAALASSGLPYLRAGAIGGSNPSRLGIPHPGTILGSRTSDIVEPAEGFEPPTC